MSTLTVKDKNSTAYAIVHLQKNGLAAMVEYFRSNRVKKPERFLTRTPEKAISDRFESLAAYNERVKERRAERNVPHNYEVGDVLYCSWGYSMSLGDFYRVTKLIGKQTVELEKLSNIDVDGNGWSGHHVPDLESKGEYAGKFRVSRGDSVKVGYSQYAGKWDGRPKYYNTMD